MPLDDVLLHFPGAKKTGNGYKARCPAHTDKTPSLSISEGDSGNVLLHCHAGCEIEGVLGAAGLTRQDLRQSREPQTMNQKMTTYDYRDENGVLLYQAVRLEPKKFFQRRPDGDGWVNSLNGTRRVPYRLPELLTAESGRPVFIVEGEKDVDLLYSIGAVATCNPGGAGKWKDEYSGFLDGRRCVILPDNDEPGEKHADAIAQSLSEHASGVNVLRLPGLPEKGDVSDWIDCGGTYEDLLTLLSDVAENVNTGDAGPLPKNYVLEAQRIYYQGEKAKTFICSALRITAKTCDTENESWGRRLEFKDDQNVRHDLVIPMSLLSGDGSELRARLMDAGLIINSGADARQKFLQYILTADSDKHVRCVNQLGWHDGAFVLPDEVISANGNRDSLLLQNVDRGANKFKTSGTLAEWQDNVARYCVGNSRLMFAVSAAFASALLPIAEEGSGGFHLYGTSSTGKTTALLVAGSVWGGDPRKGFLETWRSTTNGLEAVAELHNHSLLLLDEVSQVNPHEIGETVYGLSNGFGKSRMNRNITARRKAEWNLMFFSSGEKTLEQIMLGIGQRVFGGQEARFVNIAADADRGHGLFDDLHSYATASDLAKDLGSMSRRFYGTPIRHFLHMVCERRGRVENRIKECRQMFQARAELENASGEVYRVASRFALVTAAGILAAEFGVTNWQKQDLIACGERLFSEWLAARGTSGSYDTAQGVRQVLSFIAEHGSSRFQFLNASDEAGTERIQNRAGFKRIKNQKMQFLILREIFDGEICKGNRPTAIAKELERLGYLERGSEPECLQDRIKLPEIGRQRVYVVTPGETDAE